MIAEHRYPVVLCDRSALDNYVYLLLAAGRQEGLDSLVGFWMATYDLLIQVPIVGEATADGIRTTDPVFQRAIEERLDREIAERKLSALRLDPAARDGWLDAAEHAVMERLSPRQLQLL